MRPRHDTKDDTPFNRVRRGIINLERTDPFFSSIVINLKLIETAAVPTMCTNGKVLMFNPEFVQSCSRLKLDIVLVHESVHVALGHPLLLLRFPDRDTAMMAAELAANSLIYLRNGFPDDGVLPGRGEYSKLPIGRNTEWYYYELKKQQAKQPDPGNESKCPGESDDSSEGDKEETKDEGSGSDDSSGEDSGDGSEKDRDTQTTGEGDEPSTASGSGDGSGSEESDSQGGTGVGQDNQGLGTIAPYDLEEGESVQAAERKWEQVVSQAANLAASAGNLPGAFEELVNRLIGTTELPWYILLRIYLTRNVRHGRSYRRPNRRTLWRKDIQPSRMTRGLGKLVLGVDTSGSMDQNEMNKALATCIDIGKVYPDFELGIAQFDTAVAHTDWFTRFNTNRDYFKGWGWKGRGGTSYKAFFDQIKSYNANVIVVVTDGYPNDGWPDMRKVRTPVIWLITKEAIVPEDVSKRSRVIMLNSK